MNALRKKLHLAEIKELFNSNTPLLKELFTNNLNNKNLLIYDDKGVAVLSFDNPSKLNSMDLDCVKEYYNWLQTYLFFPQKLPIFIGDKNSKIFSAGGDLKYMYSLKNNTENFWIYNNLYYYILFKQFETFFQEENNCIYVMNGITMGGGFALGAYSKFRVATESTLLAMPESLFGHFSNCTFSHFIYNFLENEKEALYMSLFSHQYRGYEVYSKNFATHFILNKYLRNLITDIKGIDFAYNNKKEIENYLNYYQEISIKEYSGIIKEVRENLEKFDEFVKKLFNFEINQKNFKEFYENIKNNVHDKNLREEFEKRCLLTLKMNFDITMASYDNNIKFQDRYDLEMDYTEISLDSGNIFEGIRAYFIDKDQKPGWKVNSFEELEKYKFYY
jgi:3-hydroxyisobutyryl-CoA hydrolase